jgi:hypothetical protein
VPLDVAPLGDVWRRHGISHSHHAPLV